MVIKQHKLVGKQGEATIGESEESMLEEVEQERREVREKSERGKKQNKTKKHKRSPMREMAKEVLGETKYFVLSMSLP